MEQITNLFSLIPDEIQANKNKNGLLQVVENADGLPLLFGELVFDAFNTAAAKATNASSEVSQMANLKTLKGQIEGLNVDTINLLEDAFQQSAAPEVVDDILSKAVSELWALLENFDVQNGTQYTSKLSQAVIGEVSNLEGAELMPSPLAQSVHSWQSSGEYNSIFSASSKQSASNALEVGQVIAPIFKQISNFLMNLGGVSKQASGLVNHNQTYATYPVVEPNMLGKGQEAQFLVGGKTAQSVIGEVVLDQAKPPLLQGTSTTTPVSIENYDAKIKEIFLKVAQITVSGKENSLRFHDIDSVISPLRDTVTPSLKAELQFSNTLSTLHGKNNSTANFAQKITSQIQSQILNEGITRIELSPRGLGNILIDLQKQETGGVQVVMRAENPAVLNALRTDRDALMNMISDGNALEEDVSLDFEGFGQGAFQNEANDMDGSNTTNEITPEADEARTVNSSTVNEVGSGRLNIIT